MVEGGVFTYALTVLYPNERKMFYGVYSAYAEKVQVSLGKAHFIIEARMNLYSIMEEFFFFNSATAY